LGPFSIGWEILSGSEGARRGKRSRHAGRRFPRVSFRWLDFKFIDHLHHTCDAASERDEELTLMKRLHLALEGDYTVLGSNRKAGAENEMLLLNEETDTMLKVFIRHPDKRFGSRNHG
jgi:hypothetical protein